MNAIIFCGLATAVGWGLRGEFGGTTGALIPGALLGLAIALTSCRSDWLRQAPLLGAAGALGTAVGGMMSYGIIIGYTRGTDLTNVTYGYAMLGVVGGLWGAFAAGVIAMAVSPRRYKIWQVVAFIIAARYTGSLVHWLLVSQIGLRMTPPRGDGWAVVLGAVIALLVFARIKRDPLVARLTFWGAAAGSAGFMIGEAFQIIGGSLGPPFDWWKVMEQVFGFILGAGIAYGLRTECGELRKIRPPSPLVYAFAIAVTVWLVPVITFNDVLGKFAEHGILTPDVGTSMSDMIQPRLNVLFVLAVFIVLWRVYAGWPIADPRTTAIGIFLWVLWTCIILGLFQKGTPEWTAQGIRVHNGFLIFATIISFWSIIDFQHDAGWYESRKSLKKWVPAWAAAFLITALTLATLSIASHWGEYPPGAHVRFGEVPVSEP